MCWRSRAWNYCKRMLFTCARVWPVASHVQLRCFFCYIKGWSALLTCIPVEPTVEVRVGVMYCVAGLAIMEINISWWILCRVSDKFCSPSHLRYLCLTKCLKKKKEMLTTLPRHRCNTNGNTPIIDVILTAISHPLCNSNCTTPSLMYY